ncbi:MAG: type II secretion system major pseudopilin GspG [Thermodesulfobacteriota bacterium]
MKYTQEPALSLQRTPARPHSTDGKPEPCTSRQLNQGGFTLIELLVVLVIIGILAGYVGPRIMGHPEDAKRTMAEAQMTALETALESYKLDNGVYPSTEQGLQALVEQPSGAAKWRKGGYMKKGKVPMDPWGNDYLYLSPGTHSDFDIISYGSDRESGGEEENADVNNWEIE